MSEDIKLVRHAMTPRCNEDGTPRGFAPWKPVVDACSLCPARCCRMTVRCSLPDVVRYCRVLDVPWQAGFRLVAGDSQTGFTVETEDGERNLDFALHQASSGDCANLVDHHGYWRCGAYAARPTACRLYPVAYETETRKGGAGYVLCMVPYGITPSRETELDAEIRSSIDGWALHERIRGDWAKRTEDRSEAAMVRFVLTEVAKALDYAPERLLAAEAPQVRLTNLMKDVGLVR